MTIEAQPLGQLLDREHIVHMEPRSTFRKRCSKSGRRGPVGRSGGDKLSAGRARSRPKCQRLGRSRRGRHRYCDCHTITG